MEVGGAAQVGCLAAAAAAAAAVLRSSLPAQSPSSPRSFRPRAAETVVWAEMVVRGALVARVERVRRASIMTATARGDVAALALVGLTADVVGAAAVAQAGRAARRSACCTLVRFPPRWAPSRASTVVEARAARAARMEPATPPLAPMERLATSCRRTEFGRLLIRGCAPCTTVQGQADPLHGAARRGNSMSTGEVVRGGFHVDKQAPENCRAGGSECIIGARHELCVVGGGPLRRA